MVRARGEGNTAQTTASGGARSRLSGDLREGRRAKMSRETSNPEFQRRLVHIGKQGALITPVGKLRGGSIKVMRRGRARVTCRHTRKKKRLQMGSPDITGKRTPVLSTGGGQERRERTLGLPKLLNAAPPERFLQEKNGGP